MTTPKGVVVVSPESTSKNQFLASIESKNQFLASFEKFHLDRKINFWLQLSRKINFWHLSRNFISTERKRPEEEAIRKNCRKSFTQTI